jgi:hypothetical protein
LFEVPIKLVVRIRKSDSLSNPENPGTRSSAAASAQAGIPWDLGFVHLVDERRQGAGETNKIRAPFRGPSPFLSKSTRELKL